MALPYQTANSGASHQSYPSTQGLMGSHSSIAPESQGSMEGPSGMNPTGSSQPPKDFNMAFLCRIGQETVQEIVSKTTELFQTLRSLQPPNGAGPGMGIQEELKAQLQENVKYISMCFHKLRRIYEKCNENCAGLEYSHIEVDSLVPLEDEMDSRVENRKSSENIKYATEEHRELVEQVMLKNRQLKEVIDNLRIFVWDINTMLAVRKP